MGIDDPYSRWCFNEAVFIFGNHVEAQMNEAAKNKKKAEEITRARQTALQAALRDDIDTEEVPKGAFRDPAQALKGKKS